MRNINIKSFAKINLSLDVHGKLDNGMHKVETIMQQILLCDDVSVRWHSKTDKRSEPMILTELSTNKYYLPTDERNLAYKAAMLMAENFGGYRNGTIRIDIKKRIPVAAGLAGGSSNCAAVLHALNILWGLRLSLRELSDLGSRLGSDVPFCIMGQAAADENLSPHFQNDKLSCHCALATGTGTDLMPVTGLKSHLVLSKPPVSVSTAEVYKGIDNTDIPVHPNTAQLIKALQDRDLPNIGKNMINVLENFTLKRYPTIVHTKNKMQILCKDGYTLMSGSGPTVFGLCKSKNAANAICRKMLAENRESFYTRTTW